MSRPALVFLSLCALGLLSVGLWALLRPAADGAAPPADTAAPHTAPAQDIAAGDQAFYDALSAMAATRTAADVSAYISLRTHETPRLLAVALDWARDHSAGQQDPQKVNAFYFMLYADLAYLAAQAFKTQGIDSEYEDLSKAAFASLLTFDLLAATDALRCADKTVRELRAPLVTPRYELLDDVFDLLTYEEMQNLFISILRAESAMGGRAPNRELCAGGSAGKLALLTHPETRREEVEIPELPGMKRTILIPPEDFSYEPDYVPLDAWLEARGKMQHAVRDSWFQRQMNYANRKAAEMRRAQEKDGTAPGTGANGADDNSKTGTSVETP